VPLATPFSERQIILTTADEPLAIRCVANGGQTIRSIDSQTPPHWTRRMKITRRRLLKGAAATAGLGLATGLYTWRIEPHWLEIVERSLPIANLPSVLEGARLAQLSDLHIGPQVDDAYLLKTFARVRALAPEIVVYTGDFTSYALNVCDHARRIFNQMPLGSRATFGILGNHDYGPNCSDFELADNLAALTEAAGVQILRNEVREVDGLQVIGLEDLWSGRFNVRKAIAEIDLSQAVIALSHNPDTADEPGWDNYESWILAGHTHGGQCKAPFLPPPMLPVKNRRYTSGEFELSSGRRMYINRGVGHLLRVRINARPEVTLFQLTRS
jgi:predicted MPP superfamily phosphohydrolase